MIYKKDKIDMSLVQCPYEEEHKYIYISDDYTNNILKLSGYNEISDGDFETLCFHNALVKYLSEYASKSASTAYHYALSVQGGRVELGEPLVADSPLYSLYYARDVLKGRFELGESAIAKDAVFSYYYAHDVLNGRFELGEPVIVTDSCYSYRYARDILNGRFELGEPAISTDAAFSYYYAQDVLKDRFELGEATIANYSVLKKKYFKLTGIRL